MTDIKRRVEKLEGQTEATPAPEPGYLVVDDLDDPRLIGWRGKVYTRGCSPDDWPDPPGGENEEGQHRDPA